MLYGYGEGWKGVIVGFWYVYMGWLFVKFG